PRRRDCGHRRQALVEVDAVEEDLHAVRGRADAQRGQARRRADQRGDHHQPELRGADLAAQERDQLEHEPGQADEPPPAPTRRRRRVDGLFGPSHSPAMRWRPANTACPSARASATKVICAASALRTASAVGAETATSTATPAAAALSTISYEQRLVT